MKMSKKREAKRRGKGARGSSDDGVKRRGRGAVGRLTHELREEVCRMLWDGVTYREIVAAMGAKGIKLSMDSLTTWLKGGYQDWLVAQERGSQGERMMASALKVLKERQGTLIQEAGLQLAAEQIYQVLADFDPTVLKKGLNGNGEGYARLVQVMARLGGESLKFEKYRAEVAKSKAILEKELNAAKEAGGLTPESIAKMQQALNLM
jgi:hypothetical protein